MHQSPTAITALCLFLISCFLFSCSSVSERNAEKLRRSRQLAKAAQEMSYSANLGAQGLLDAQFTMREPNPNKYVGSLLFDRYCDQCHGKGKAPDILSNRVTESDAESDYYIISYGLKTMPAFRRRLTKFQIFDILAYMNTDFTDFKLMKSPQSTQSWTRPARDLSKVQKRDQEPRRDEKQQPER